MLGTESFTKMGIIFSKPVNYVKGKVNNAKQAVYKKVDDTKTGIKNAVLGTRDGIYQRVGDVADAVYSRVNAVRTGISSKIYGVKTSIVNKYTSTTTAVKNVFTGGATRYRNAKNAVSTRYRNTKNIITSKYTNTRDRVKNTYSRVREVKLTRWQKLKYGVLCLFLLTFFMILTSIIWDLYNGNFVSAQAKTDAVSAFVCMIGQFLWILIENMLDVGKVAGNYAVQGATIGGDYAWAGTKVGAEYAWNGAQIAGDHIYHGSVTAAQYTAEGATVTGIYVYESSQVAVDYAYQGSKVAAEYSAYAIKEGSIHFIHGTKIFFKNLAIYSYEGAIYFAKTSKVVVIGLLTGSYSGTQAIMDGSMFAFNKTYHGSITVANWTQIVAQTSWEWACITTAFVAHWSTVGATKVTSATIASTTFGWEWLCTMAIFIYDVSYASFNFVVTGTASAVNFVWRWAHFIVVDGSKALYVGLNTYGLKWLYVGLTKLADCSVICGNIVFKFLHDLGLYLGTFFYVFTSQIYAVLYIVFSFVFHIINGIMSIIKGFFRGVMYCITFLFGGVIWFLQEFITGYMFMLNKYNMYRELLFVGFVGLIVLYCTGLMRDLRRPNQLQYSDDDSDDEFDGIEPPDMDEGEESPKIKFTRPKSIELPPIYEDHGELPEYSSPDSDFDLQSDQEVPDILESSGDDRGPQSESETHTSEHLTLSEQSDFESDSEHHTEALLDNISAIKERKELNIKVTGSSRDEAVAAVASDSEKTDTTSEKEDRKVPDIDDNANTDDVSHTTSSDSSNSLQESCEAESSPPKESAS